MTISYSTKITQMKVAAQAEGQTNVVTAVGWAYVGDDGTNTAAFGGESAVNYEAGNPFTAYDDLTQEQVAQWVESGWDAEYKQMMEDAIAAQLAAMSPPLPWAEAPVSPNMGPRNA